MYVPGGIMNTRENGGHRTRRTDPGLIIADLSICVLVQALEQNANVGTVARFRAVRRTIETKYKRPRARISRRFR